MKTVLITGASRGIGRACAKQFAAAGGWRIVITCRNSTDELRETASHLRNYPDTAVLADVGDISDEAYVSSLFSRIGDNGEMPSVLINNAGIDYVGLLQDMTLSDWNRVTGVNLTAAFLTMRAAIPHMVRRHSGSIVNVSSVWGNVGGSCEAAYSASKGGIAALTRAMAKELAPSGILVNAAAFGAIDTRMNDNLSDSEKKDLASEIPLGRMGTEEEAGLLLYDLAVRYPYMTGQIVTMDGGWTV